MNRSRCESDALPPGETSVTVTMLVQKKRESCQHETVGNGAAGWIQGGMILSHLACALLAVGARAANDSDLVWRDNPRAWHQQIARIVDHRFTTFPELLSFARDAKQAGASVLMLVQIQKTEACPGPWYNGLQLCDHINGTFPAADG